MGYKLEETLVGNICIISDYASDGPYLNFEEQSVENSKDTQFDDAGIPRISIARKGTHYYFPIAIATYGLEQHAKWLSKGSVVNRNKLINVCDYLCQTQNPDGAWASDFDYEYGVPEYGVVQAGWVSALAQGFAMSVLVRGFAATGNDVYADAARRALRPFSVEVEHGGVRAKILDRWTFYEEYPTPIRTHVLNGFMFSLLGLHDVASLLKSDVALSLFEDGLESLRSVITYYDLKDISAYDLGHFYALGAGPYYNVEYHLTHVRLISALLCIRDDEVLRRVFVRWRSYCDGNQSFWRPAAGDITVSWSPAGPIRSVGDTVVVRWDLQREAVRTVTGSSLVVLKDSQPYLKMPIQEHAEFPVLLSEPGRYQMQVVLLDEFGNKFSRLSKILHVAPADLPPIIEHIVVEREIVQGKTWLSCRVQARGIGLTYAFYLRFGDEIVIKSWYQPEAVVRFPLEKTGVYSVQCFVKDAGERKIVQESERITVNELDFGQPIGAKRGPLFISYRLTRVTAFTLALVCRGAVFATVVLALAAEPGVGEEKRAVRSPIDVAAQRSLFTAASGDTSCPDVVSLPHNVEEVVYYTDPPYYSKIDPTKYAQEMELQASRFHEEDALAHAVTRFVTAEGEPAQMSAHCILVHLMAFVHDDAFNGTDNQRGSAQVRLHALTPILAYVVLRDGFSIPAEQDGKIWAWIRRLANNLARYDRQFFYDNNIGYWGAADLAFAAVALNDERYLTVALQIARRAVGQIDEQGLFPREMIRGDRALEYSLYAMQALAAVALVAEANGIDLYRENNYALRHAMEQLAHFLNDPESFVSITKNPQTVTTDKIYSQNLGWLEAYRRLSSDPAVDKLICSRRPLYSYRNGGDWFVLFGDPHQCDN